MVTSVSLVGECASHEFRSAGKYTYFTTYFIPPDMISGKLCLMQVRSASVLTKSLTDKTDQVNGFVTLSWKQPNSFSSVFDETSLGNIYGSDYRECRVPAGSQNSIVAEVFTIPNSHDTQVMHGVSEFPRCLVQIPNGPEVLEVGFFPNTLTNDSLYDIAAESISLLLEIQAFEAD